MINFSDSTVLPSADPPTHKKEPVPSLLKYRS
jgi:hypothetical protein